MFHLLLVQGNHSFGVALSQSRAGQRVAGVLMEDVGILWRRAFGQADEVVENAGERLLSRGLAAHRGAEFFDDLARQSTRNPESTRVVLGKWQQEGKGYTRVAAHYRASYFKATDYRELTKTLTPDELWKINEAFLDQQIRAGKQILLSHDPSTATGFYLREVQYLEDLGYRFVQENWIWKAVR